MGDRLEVFCRHLNGDNEWPVVEGFRIRPSDVLATNKIYFTDAYSTWAETDVDIEVRNPTAGTERDDDFDAYVNGERPTGWVIDGFEISAADALATDAERYRQALLRWRAQRWREQDALLTERFPSPIALRFGRFLAYSDPEKKLRWLLQTWEAAAILFTTLVLCEIREHAIDATRSNVSPSKQLKGFWNFRTVTEVLDAVILEDFDIPMLAGRDRTRLSRAVNASEDIIADIDAVRGLRNDGAHFEPLNPSRARKRIELYESQFRERVLDHLDGLQDVQLCAYERDLAEELQDSWLESDEEVALSQLEVWSFRGLVTEKRANETIEVTEDERYRIVSRRDSCSAVYAKRGDGPPILLSPLIRWFESEEGHARYLGYLADVRGEEKSRTFEYLTFGDSKRHLCSERQLEQDLEALHRCFRRQGTPSKKETQKKAAAARRSVSKRTAQTSAGERTRAEEPTS